MPGKTSSIAFQNPRAPSAARQCIAKGSVTRGADSKFRRERQTAGLEINQWFASALCAFACLPALQMRAMHATSDAPTSMTIAAFSLGNAFGAGIGGLALGAGWWGYASVPVAGAVRAFVGFVVIWLMCDRVRVAAD